MKSILKTVILVLAVMVQPLAEASAADKPLMVVRFTNPYVEYQTSLGMVVRSAVKAKKDVIFDVVAGNQVIGAGSRVAQDIIAMGVKPVNVNVRRSGINNNEVLIFVR